MSLAGCHASSLFPHQKDIPMFSANLHSFDRIARLVLGLALLSLVFVGPQTPWGYIGTILIVTAFINFCPMYKLLGLSTRKKS
jgi:hypothetical protein